jgi:hypothetical protein
MPEASCAWSLEQGGVSLCLTQSEVRLVPALSPKSMGFAEYTRTRDGLRCYRLEFASNFELASAKS